MKILLTGLILLGQFSAYASDYSYEDKAVDVKNGVVSVTYKSPKFKSLPISATDYQKSDKYLLQRDYDIKDLCSLMGENYNTLQHAQINSSYRPIKRNTKYAKIETRPRFSRSFESTIVDPSSSDSFENKTINTETYTVSNPYKEAKVEIRTRDHRDRYVDSKSIDYLRCHSKLNH
ncbi:MAG: hypothetical protein ACJAS4_003807 [Bacteriovoracaceae bacterium]|jgi:hypothetical protein